MPASTGCGFDLWPGDSNMLQGNLGPGATATEFVLKVRARTDEALSLCSTQQEKLQ